MPHFSAAELNWFEEASTLLLKAEVQLPVLKTLVWDRSLADEFYKRKEKWLPVIEYQKLNASTIKEQISSCCKVFATM
jgi:hypothetical protein